MSDAGVIAAVACAAGALLVSLLALLLLWITQARQSSTLQKLVETLAGQDEILDSRFAQTREALAAELVRLRDSSTGALSQQRQELGTQLASNQQSIAQQTGAVAQLIGTSFESFARQLATLAQSSEERLREMRATLQGSVEKLQASNEKKLEEMRNTVDEKLQATLETRLGEQFKQVAERLERVHQGLGEMTTLAQGVGDLKRVLTNVKSRGGWGEVQLESLIEQVLTIEQYAKNVATVPGSAERVEFAVRLPGREAATQPVWLPIDAKFPREDYERLLLAQDAADAEGAKIAAAQLERAVRAQAREIQQKYLAPPHTTDFAVMFLPVEGLYAETLRRPGLIDVLQREFRVVLAGPTTFAALLNSLQMGFRTLAIEKRSSEVWRVLGEVKTEFGKFGDVLDKVGEKLSQAQKQIEQTGVRTRAIQKQLRGVEALTRDTPAESTAALPPADLDE